MRSLARDFSSSRRAPPMAASKPYWSSACFSALGLHHVGVHGGAVADRADALRDAVGVGVHAQVDAGLGGAAIAEGDHLAELPAGVDVQQRDRRRRRCERLQQQVQQHRAVLADRVQHHRVAELGRDLAQDVDALGFEAVEVAQVDRQGHRSGGSWGCGTAAGHGMAEPEAIGTAGGGYLTTL